ncbi:uncharacterized protein LOC143327479 [Chaetodon auriga]|uniref:uncharacterized protein LOC143327479 n=1 Tax=Chaetodon auriga TaxID=39042 RepID=UPI004032F35B
MAEHQSKSKLKRKKSSFSEDHHPETSSRGTLSRSHTMFSSYTAAEPGRSAVPAAAWWSGEQLPAVESLWALTLKSARLQQLCDLVPDLPHPSTAGPKALEVDERWCDLSEEVAPFPEPSPPSPRTSLSPDLLRLSPSLQDLLVQTKPAPENEEEGVEDIEEEEAQRSVRGDGAAAGGGGGGLQSCPMCLLVFPAGFTQMDCDGHLAQCLSEVNVDMTW